MKPRLMFAYSLAADIPAAQYATIKAIPALYSVFGALYIRLLPHYSQSLVACILPLVLRIYQVKITINAALRQAVFFAHFALK